MARSPGRLRLKSFSFNFEQVTTVASLNTREPMTGDKITERWFCGFSCGCLKSLVRWPKQPGLSLRDSRDDSLTYSRFCTSTPCKVESIPGAQGAENGISHGVVATFQARRRRPRPEPDLRWPYECRAAV